VSSVLIAGAGIGGLASAIALRTAGMEVFVCEKEADLRESGAGLTLWPNAVHALRRLGLGSRLDGLGVRLQRSDIYSRSGKLLATAMMDDYVGRYGAPAMGIHRADLLSLLADALGRRHVRLDARLKRFEERDGRVSAQLAGTQIEVDLLVGADGVHSTVRRLLRGSEPPRHSGHFAWRGIASGAAPAMEPNSVGVVLARGSHFGWLPVGEGRTYWFGVGRTGEDPDPMRHFLNWASPVPELVQATPPGSVLIDDLVDRPPSSTWGRGRVTLVGDAAHAMLPGLGQGACSALEDAVVLGEKVASTGDPVTALRRYERDRRRRARRLQSASRLGFEFLQWRNPLARSLRAALFKLPPALLQRQQSWMFSYGRLMGGGEPQRQVGPSTP
jgi:2-polyprenyl-6-methoxyphenol hydroxylase-like FAD-dependent oxidoreductase